MEDGKIEKEAIRLQEAADRNNMQPIWGYQRQHRENSKSKNIAIKKTDGTEFQWMTETMKRWEDWAEECFSKKSDQLTPEILHIQELELGAEEMHIAEDIQLIRQHAALTMKIQEEPDTETWLNQEYDEQDIGRELRSLPNRKAHGSDGIPGEAYKATRTWEIKP